MHLNLTGPEVPVRRFSGFWRQHYTLAFFMRVSIFYLALLTLSIQLLLASSGNGQSITEIKVTVGMRAGENLESLFKKIEKQSGLLFAFDYVKVNQYNNITLTKATRTIKETLDIVLEETPFLYRQVKNSVIIFQEGEEPKLSDETFLSNEVAAGQLRVTGKVKDVEGTPMAGVNVIVKGTTRGTSTDANGDFSIDADDNEILVFSFIGFKTFETQVNARVVVDVTLEEEMEALQEVVVNAGYWDVKEREKTGSISRVTAEVIEKQPVTNPLQTIQGRVPGISIMQESGIPGSNFQVRIRGTNSIQNGNNPLYVIDGVPFISEMLSVSQSLYGSYFEHGTQAGAKGISPLNSINPNDIESIEILKDADATAIYGSRGANGVVLITTKKGKAGAVKVDVNFKSGISEVTRRLDLMNTKQYIAMRMKAVANDGDVAPGNREYDINGTWDQNRYTDWQNVLIGGTAKMTDINTSISGGNNETQFLFSAGYNDQGTVFPGDNMARRFSTHFSVLHNSPNRKFSTRLSTSYILNNNNIVAQDLTYKALVLAPNAPGLYDGNGNLNWENSTWENPLAQLKNRFNSNTYNLLTNVEFGYEIVTGMGIKASFGLNDIRSADRQTNLSSSYKPSENKTPANDTYLYAISGTNQSWIVEPQLNWEKKVGKSKLTILMGATYQNRINESNQLNYKGFASNALVNDLNSAASIPYRRNTYAEYKYAAGYGRINYNWNEKYILNITGRRDASSRFGPGKKVADLGAAGIAWIFSNEDFIKNNISLLSFGKLRGSYGLTGNDQIGDYQYLDTYISNVQYQGIGTLGPNRLFNPEYGWEVNKKLEGAIELGFLNDQILLTAAWYRNRSSNQLINYQLAGTTGYPSVLQNSPATVQNTGLELELTTINISKGSLTWTTAFNITFPRNKLVAFPNLESSSYANTYIVGKPLNIRKVYHYLSVDPTTGLYEVEDVNDDGQYTPEDKVSHIVYGQNYYGGLNSSIAFKGLQVDIFFQFVNQKGELSSFDFDSRGFDYWTGNGNLQAIATEGRWEEPGDVATKQRFSRSADADASFNRFATSDALAGETYFIRLKNVSVSYQVSDKWLGGIKSRVFAQVQNLLTFTNYKGLDPETGGGTLPPLTTLVAGLQLTF